MPVSKIRKRKVAKKYEIVTFETPIFEGQFKFPSAKHLPVRVLTSFQKGEVDALFTWLAAAGVPTEDIDALQDLDGEELSEFMSNWTDGDVPVPKS